MKNNNKNVIIASLSAVVVCTLCIAIVFLFPSKGNDGFQDADYNPDYYDNYYEEDEYYNEEEYYEEDEYYNEDEYYDENEYYDEDEYYEEDE